MSTCMKLEGFGSLRTIVLEDVFSLCLFDFLSSGLKTISATLMLMHYWKVWKFLGFIFGP